MRYILPLYSTWPLWPLNVLEFKGLVLLLDT